MSLTRFQKRNQLHLDAPVPDTPEARSKTEAHHKQFGKTVIWNTAVVVTEEVGGQKITTKTAPVIEVKEDKEEPVLGKEPEVIVPDEPTEPEVPEDLKCPHCGSTARTPESYRKNHGDNCYRKDT